MAKLFDDQFYSIADFINPYFYKIGFTPNIVTMLSFLFAIISATLFFKDYRILAVMFYLINYILDCADGNMARKYKMESKLGDTLDKVTDTLTHIMFMVICYLKNKYLAIKLIPVLIIMTLIINNDCGCRTTNNRDKMKIDTNAIRLQNKFCLINNEKFIYFFNTSTVIIFICIIILYYK